MRLSGGDAQPLELAAGHRPRIVPASERLAFERFLRRVRSARHSLPMSRSGGRESDRDENARARRMARLAPRVFRVAATETGVVKRPWFGPRYDLAAAALCSPLVPSARWTEDLEVGLDPPPRRHQREERLALLSVVIGP